MPVSRPTRGLAVILSVAALHCGGDDQQTGEARPTGAGASGAAGQPTAGGAAGAAGVGGATDGGSAGLSGASGQGGATAGAGGEAGAGGSEAGQAGQGAGGESGAAGEAGASGQAGDGGGGGALRLPQFVRGAAQVSALAYESIPLVIEAEGAPEIKLTVGGTEVAVSAQGSRWIGSVAVQGLEPGEYPVEAQAAGWEGAVATLRVSARSVPLTTFAQDGGATTGTFHADAAHDQIVATWADRRDGDKHAYMALLDGAGRRLRDEDIRLDVAEHSAIRVYSALGDGSVGYLYQTLKGGTFGAYLRVVDLDGAELVPLVDLTGAEGSYVGAAIAWDGAGYAVLWQHVTQPDYVTELRWLRVDAKSGQQTGPVVIAREDDQAEGGKAKDLVHLGLYSLACTPTTCVAAYPRQLYNSFVDLDQSKIFTASVALPGGEITRNAPFDGINWDLQEDPHVTASHDGRFALAFVGSTLDVDPKDPCDEQLIRYLLYTGRLDETGKPVGKKTKLIDEPGSRFQPTVAARPDGFAIAWEDQRSQCQSGGTNRLAFHTLDDKFKPGQPYAEIPMTRLIGQVWPTVIPAGSNTVLGWMNDLQGSILDPMPELWFDTRWQE